MPTPTTSFDVPAEEPAARVHVLLPLPLTGAYDYRVAHGVDAAPGAFVVVPLGRRLVAGVVWGDGPADADDALPDDKLKDVVDALPVPAMPRSMRRFVDWVAGYTCSAPGAVLRMAMSVPAALEAPKPQVAYVLDGPPPPRMTAARGRVVDALVDGPPRSLRELVDIAGVGAGVVRGLVAAGTLREILRAMPFDQPPPDPARAGPALTDTQAEAATALIAKVDAGGFSATLLDGVTGAGKTEVYFEAIARALERGRQVLVLVPEIAMTAQWFDRFQQRFGASPVEWHSDLRSSQRRANWRAVAEGRARVVVGARSALFLPFRDLGLIVVDEEHDVAFKQEDGVIYHARDMAVVRASLQDIPIVLVSATPALETMVNVQQARYAALHLPGRPGAAELPDVGAIDMRRDPPPRGRFLSPLLADEIASTLAAGEQALLFLNRRGYAPLTLCRACGHRLECPNCTAWLVEHRFAARLQCHHCGFAAPLPDRCPNCEAEQSFAACGPGVERLLEEVGTLFPEARALMVASDTVYGPRGAAEVVRAIVEHEVDLIIGTQIVAKGLNFPLLTLVGVVDADLGLAGGDLRAVERTYQLLSQVSGRAGRAERPGRALLQTYMPEHPVMQALVSGDRQTFIDRETEARRTAHMPPFARLVAVIVSGPDEARVADTAAALGRCAPASDTVEVLGPAPAPMTLLRGRFRYRLLMRTPRRTNASELARAWVAKVKPAGNVRIAVDVDPYSFV